MAVFNSISGKPSSNQRQPGSQSKKKAKAAQRQPSGQSKNKGKTVEREPESGKENEIDYYSIF